MLVVGEVPQLVFILKEPGKVKHKRETKSKKHPLTKSMKILPLHLLYLLHKTLRNINYLAVRK